MRMGNWIEPNETSHEKKSPVDPRVVVEADLPGCAEAKTNKLVRKPTQSRSGSTEQISRKCRD